MRLAACALFVCSFACGGASESGSEASGSDKAAALAPLDAKAAADAVASVAFGAPEAHPELALRALAELERQRLGPSLTKGFVHLADADPNSRAKSAAPALATNVKLLDAACGGAGEALLRVLGQIDESSWPEVIWSRCAFEAFGLLSASEAMRRDPTTLLLLHMAYSKLAAAGALDDNELALFALALRFGSETSSAEASPDPVGSPNACVALAASFDRVFEAADPSCESNADCSCSPGGISEKAGCGRVTSIAVATQLGQIYADFRSAGCPLLRNCAPRKCEAKCVDGRCQ